MAATDWKRFYWEIPLENPPQVVAISKNVHGIDPTDVYRLPDLWSLHVYCYTAKLFADGVELPIREGHIGLTPPGVTNEFHYVGISPHLYVHFRLPTSGVRTRRVRAMQDAGERYPILYRDLADVIGLAYSEPARVNARVWDVLWQLCDLHGESAPGDAPHPAVRRATNFIERNLAESLSVRDLATEARVSYSYLGRLFQEEYGEPVVSYIRRRRMERAMHLLEHSTLPVKFIATSVGIPDLQHFNKAVRQFAGVGPRGVRLRPRQTP